MNCFKKERGLLEKERELSKSKRMLRECVGKDRAYVVHARESFEERKC